MTGSVLLQKGLKKPFLKITRFLYPTRCPICDDPAWPTDRGICFSCMKKLKANAGFFCEKCGKKLTPGDGLCNDCKTKGHVFERCRSAFEYDGISESLYRFKYLGRREYAKVYAGLSVEVLRDYLTIIKPDVITPVPLSREKENKRGYNQALDLCVALSAETGIPVLPDTVRRVKNTAPMKLLSPSERQKNLKNAFKSGENVVKSKRVLLVDDIYTTGATMDACAEILYGEGADSVYCLTISSGAGI